MPLYTCACIWEGDLAILLGKYYILLYTFFCHSNSPITLTQQCWARRSYLPIKSTLGGPSNTSLVSWGILKWAVLPIETVWINHGEHVVLTDEHIYRYKWLKKWNYLLMINLPKVCILSLLLKFLPRPHTKQENLSPWAVIIPMKNQSHPN